MGYQVRPCRFLRDCYVTGLTLTSLLSVILRTVLVLVLVALGFPLTSVLDGVLVFGVFGLHEPPAFQRASRVSFLVVHALFRCQYSVHTLQVCVGLTGQCLVVGSVPVRAPLKRRRLGVLVGPPAGLLAILAVRPLTALLTAMSGAISVRTLVRVGSRDRWW